MSEVTTFGPTSWTSLRGAQNTAQGAVGQYGAGVNVQQSLPNGAKRSTNAGGFAVEGLAGIGRSSTTTQPNGTVQKKAGGLLVTPYGVAGAQGQKTTTPDGSYTASGRFGVGAVVEGVGVGLTGKGTQTYDAATGTKVTDTSGKLGILAPEAGVLGASSQGHTVQYADGSYDHTRSSVLGATNGVDAFGLQSNAHRAKSADGTITDQRQLGFSSTFSDSVWLGRDVTISPTGQVQGTRTVLGQTQDIDRQSHRLKYRA